VSGGAFRSAGDVVWPLPPQGNGQDGSPAVYGVRPEHLTLSANGIPATIQVIEPTGSETHIIAKVGGTPLVCTFRERITAGPGDTIGLMPDPAQVHLFHEGTGQRLN
jgi:multiple sugar transport system ATP-binding protein